MKNVNSQNLNFEKCPKIRYSRKFKHEKITRSTLYTFTINIQYTVQNEKQKKNIHITTITNPA